MGSRKRVIPMENDDRIAIGQSIDAFMHRWSSHSYGVLYEHGLEKAAVVSTLRSFQKHEKNKNPPRVWIQEIDEYEAKEFIRCLRHKTYHETEIPNAYFLFLYDAYGIPRIELPRQLSTVERRMSLMKDMHSLDSDAFSIEKIADRYMVTERTIEKDLHELKYGMQIMNQRLKIDFVRRGGVITQASTAHPILLVQNLSQVVCLLEGQRLAACNPLMRETALSTAASIWQQLSHYARRRILDVLTECLNLDKKWYEAVDARAAEHGDLFRAEAPEETGGKPVALLMYCTKVSKRIVFSWRKPDGSTENVGPVKMRSDYDESTGQIIISTDDGQEFVLSPFDLLDLKFADRSGER